jgi:hypothetical protein
LQLGSLPIVSAALQFEETGGRGFKEPAVMANNEMNARREELLLVGALVDRSWIFSAVACRDEVEILKGTEEEVMKANFAMVVSSLSLGCLGWGMRDFC